MEGWADLFKQFLGSKLASVCLLITSATLLFAPKYMDFVPEIPVDWKWIGFGIMIFTAMTCAYWIAKEAFRIACRITKEVQGKMFPLQISDLSYVEQVVLVCAAGNGGHFRMNDVSQYTLQNQKGHDSPSDIEVDLAVSSLCKHGLMQYGMIGGSFLTHDGKHFIVDARRNLGN